MIFFPRMYQPDEGGKEGGKVSQAHLAVLYDECIREALKVCVPERLSHWPVSYERSMTQSRDSKGQFHFSSVGLANGELADFINALSEKLDAHEYFLDWFFLHEWRGYKEETTHNPVVRDDIDEKLDYMCKDLLFSKINMEDWFIDVGLEIWQQGKSIQWRENMHMQLLRSLLPNSTEQQCNDVKNSKKWLSDPLAHLYQLAGFRVETSAAARKTDHIIYLNVYTTDKQATYQMHTGAYRHHRAQDLLPPKIEHLIRDIETLRELYYACGDKVQDGAARAEVRISLLYARFPLVDYKEITGTCVVAIDAVDLWSVVLLIYTVTVTGPELCLLCQTSPLGHFDSGEH